MKYDQEKGDRSVNSFEQEGLVECYKDSSNNRVLFVPYSELRAPRLKKTLLSYLLWPILGFLISFLFSVHIQVKIVL